MAEIASGSQSFRSYDYRTETVTKSYSIEEAIDKSITGEIDLLDVFLQLPDQLKKEIDRISKVEFSKQFIELQLSERCKIAKILKSEIAKANQSKPRTILDALKLAQQGSLDEIEVFNLLPDEIKTALDSFSNILHKADFSKVQSEDRKQILGLFLEATQNEKK